MQHEVCFNRTSDRFDSDLKPFQAVGGRLPGMQAHSSRVAYRLPACHPQLGQSEHRCQLHRVLDQSFVEHLGRTELAFDDPKRVLHLGTNAGLELPDLLGPRTPRHVLLYLALARVHGHVPVRSRISSSTNRCCATEPPSMQTHAIDIIEGGHEPLETGPASPISTSTRRNQPTRSSHSKDCLTLKPCDNWLDNTEVHPTRLRVLLVTSSNPVVARPICFIGIQRFSELGDWLGFAEIP